MPRKSKPDIGTGLDDLLIPTPVSTVRAARPARAARSAVAGPRLRKCRTCGDPELSSRLVHGQCPECIGLQTLPLRGQGGRFISFTARPVAQGGGAA
ncbi:hypothetical protein ACIB24_02470 [Spongisporangium articulatum]|uniref:Uncharacterized protein n=1 Tax=Spongisporangium articulatum TaxID=3362603 RepID=A0ABW8AIX6_9ACTN